MSNDRDRKAGPAGGMRLVEEPRGDSSTARWLCQACDLAYLGAAEGRQAFAERLGLEAVLFSVDNTQAWLGTSPDAIVVAFRGTESPTTIDGLKDILLTDAMNLLVVPEGRLGVDLSAAGVGARYHKGFVDAIAEIWEPLAAAVETELQRRDRPLWLCGHSLGGALALLAAWLFKRRFVSVQEVCTFGAPMIGNSVAREAFNRELAGRVFRYVNGRDPVPKLPAISLAANAFEHVESQRLLGSEPMTGLGELFGGLASKAAGSLLAGDIVDEVWGHLTREVSAHFLGHYRGLLGPG
jgi:pimeloyl-ACP methyl ester carboxylesterase